MDKAIGTSSSRMKFRIRLVLLSVIGYKYLIVGTCASKVNCIGVLSGITISDLSIIISVAISTKQSWLSYSAD